jgi:hypothetical protein
LEDDQYGIRRAWKRRAAPGALPPVIEHLYVAAPAGVQTKERTGFQKVWNRWVHLQQEPLIEIG